MSGPPALLESELTAFLKRRRVPGAVAGLVREGAAETWGFGHVARDDARVPDADTVFEIGSITKVFTATLLARMAERGKVGLQDSIRPLLEGRVALPDWQGREVTLLHLATHTSTLPRIPKRLLLKGLLNPDNPYRDYGVENLYADLARFRPGTGLGRKYAYSNLGFGLLGHLLTLSAGRSFEELVVDEVCRPLGLSDTAITLSADQRARLAQGHWFGRPVGLWDMAALAGAGALRSTTRDMLRCLEANLCLRPTELDAALRATHAPRVVVSETLSVGLAWHVTRAGPAEDAVVLWHHGETGGMRGFIGFIPARGVGLVLLANASAGVDELGLELTPRL